MSRYFFVLGLVIMNMWATAQNNATDGKIVGKVIDSATKEPIDYATITLMAAGNSKVLGGTTADSTGSFILAGIAYGNYDVLAELLV